MSRPPKKQLCAICGKREATTRDHVPPRGIFPKPRPKLVTVPACATCNQGSSHDDEVFRTYLSLHVGASDSNRQNLFGNALSTLQHNKRLLRDVLGSSNEIPFITPSGLYTGMGLRVLWNSKSYNAVVERCIRGLYFHHFGSVLGEGVQVSVQWLRSLPPSMATEVRQLALEVVGTDQFAYRYARSPDEPRRSIWLFSFYSRHFASGHSAPIHET